MRRGAERAVIYSIAFSSTAQWLAVSSDKGTVHVFGLKVDSGALANDRSRGVSERSLSNSSAISSLSFIRGNFAMCCTMLPTLQVVTECCQLELLMDVCVG